MNSTRLRRLASVSRSTAWIDFFETEVESLDQFCVRVQLIATPFSARILCALGDGDVRLRFNQSQHMSANFVRNTRLNAEARLHQTPSVSISPQLLAHLAHILPTDAKRLARMRQLPSRAPRLPISCPQIVRICSSHRFHVAVTSPENSSIKDDCSLGISILILL